MLTIDQINLIADAEPWHDWEGRGTGGVYRPPDPRDSLLAHIPEVRDALAAPQLPETVDLSQLFADTYDQGQEGSCVAFSTCAVESADKMQEHRQWYWLDGHRIYRDNGGTGANGVAPDNVLRYAQSQGLPLLGDSRRFRIGQYVLSSRDPAGWEAEMRAALASGLPITLALLLPSEFGWTSGGDVTQGYHQVALAGYGTDPEMGAYVLLKNSWGPNWGRNGFGRVPISYITANNMQQQMAWSYRWADDLNDGLGPGPGPGPGPTPKPIPVPVPPPPPPPLFAIHVSATPNLVVGAPSQPLPPGTVCGVAIYTPDGRRAQSGTVVGGTPTPTPRPAGDADETAGTHDHP